jgi:hypothetical protein
MNEFQKQGPEVVGWICKFDTRLHNNQKAPRHELMKKKGIRVEVEYTVRIETSGVSLTMGGDQTGNKSR